MTTDDVLRKIEPSISDAVSISHPGVVFTDIWVNPRTSWCGSDMVDVWAVYEGDIDALGAPAKPSLSTLIQDIPWNMGVDASPRTHLVAKADAKDLSPETLRPPDVGREPRPRRPGETARVRPPACGQHGLLRALPRSGRVLRRPVLQQEHAR